MPIDRSSARQVPDNPPYAEVMQRLARTNLNEQVSRGEETRDNDKTLKIPPSAVSFSTYIGNGYSCYSEAALEKRSKELANRISILLSEHLAHPETSFDFAADTDLETKYKRLEATIRRTATLAEYICSTEDKMGEAPETARTVMSEVTSTILMDIPPSILKDEDTLLEITTAIMSTAYKALYPVCKGKIPDTQRFLLAQRVRSSATAYKNEKCDTLSSGDEKFYTSDQLKSFYDVKMNQARLSNLSEDYKSKILDKNITAREANQSLAAHLVYRSGNENFADMWTATTAVTCKAFLAEQKLNTKEVGQSVAGAMIHALSARNGLALNFLKKDLSKFIQKVNSVIEKHYQVPEYAAGEDVVVAAKDEAILKTCFDVSRSCIAGGLVGSSEGLTSEELKTILLTTLKDFDTKQEIVDTLFKKLEKKHPEHFSQRLTHEPANS